MPTDPKPTAGAAAADAPKRTELEQRVARYSERLSTTRRKLLQRILNEPEQTFHLSARKLAAHLNVDPATVVRTVRALGYSGFKAFSEDLRAHFVSRVTPYSVLRIAADDSGTTESHVRQSIRHDLSNLSQLSALNSTETIIEVAKQITQARRVLVVGLDLAFTMSYWLAYSLTVVGVSAEAPQDRALLRYKTQLLTSDDLLFGITFRRCMKDTVESVITAADRGVPTIALSDSTTNAVGRRADITLLSSIEGPVISGSQIAPMGVLNAVIVACAHSRVQRTLDVLRYTKQEYEKGDRWYE